MVKIENKDNSLAAYLDNVRDEVREKSDIDYKAAKKMGYGADYKYPHNYAQGYVKQDYLGAEPKEYYKPKDIGKEKFMKDYLQKLQVLIQNSKETNNPAEG